MRPLTCGVVLAGSLTIAAGCRRAPVAPVDPPLTMVYGAGLVSCGRVVGERNEDAVVREMVGGWVSGWVSAAGYYTSRVPDVPDAEGYYPSDRGPLAETEAAGMIAWVENYCRVHPLENVAAAAQALVAELRSRPRGAE